MFLDSVVMALVCSVLVEEMARKNVSEMTHHSPPYGMKGNKAMLRSVHPSVCLSRFSDSVCSLDGGMRASPLQTHLTEGSTVGYARVQISGYRIASPRDTAFRVQCDVKPFKLNQSV